MTFTRIHLRTEWAPGGWTLRFENANQNPMRLPFTLRFRDGDMILDAALLGADQFPVRHAWMDSPGGDIGTWLSHLGTPALALREPFDGLFEGLLDRSTELALTAAARARFLGEISPVHWPEGLPEAEILGARKCRVAPIPATPVGCCHPATAPLGLHLAEEPSIEPVPGSDRVHITVPAEIEGAEIAAALLTGDEVLSSNRLSPGDQVWTGLLPLYGHKLEDLHLDVFDPQVGVGLPVASRPQAWNALRTFARSCWRVELPDREAPLLAVNVSNAAGESEAVNLMLKRPGAPALRRLAVVALRCEWFGEALNPGACDVDRALAFVALGDIANAAQAVTGAGIHWLLQAAEMTADCDSPLFQHELSRACEEVSNLVGQPLSNSLRERGEMLAERPKLDAELLKVLEREPARVLGGLPRTALGQGRLWVQNRPALLAQDWNGDESDRPLLAELWAAEVRQ